MPVLDAAVNVTVLRLRSDAELAKPNGSDVGESPVGVDGEIYGGTKLPTSAKYPAILVVPQTSDNMGVAGSGRNAGATGLILVKVHTEGNSTEDTRRISERIETVLYGVRRVEWLDTVTGTRYWIASITYVRDQPQPSSEEEGAASGDRLYQYRNLEYRFHGSRRN